MLTRPAIVIAAIIAATVVIVAFVAGIVILSWNGKSTEALAIVVATPIVSALVSMLSRLCAIESKVDAAANSSNSDGGK